MIERENLERGTWYDGFIWRKGIQQGAGTKRWMNSHFTDGKGGGELLALHNPLEASMYYTFEPNVVSIGEPAA